MSEFEVEVGCQRSHGVCVCLFWWLLRPVVVELLDFVDDDNDVDDDDDVNDDEDELDGVALLL